MLDHVHSRHAEVRMRQRGLHGSDIDLVMATAARISPDAYLMTDDDVAREIAQRKAEIQQLERLRGLKVVINNDTIVTAYFAGPKNQRRTLRRGRASR